MPEFPVNVQLFSVAARHPLPLRLQLFRVQPTARQPHRSAQLSVNVQLFSVQNDAPLGVRKSESRCLHAAFPVIVLEQATQPLSAVHLSGAACILKLRCNDLVPQPLMRCHVFPIAVFSALSLNGSDDSNTPRGFP